jgi:hypothetical protein
MEVEEGKTKASREAGTDFYVVLFKLGEIVMLMRIIW